MHARQALCICLSMRYFILSLVSLLLGGCASVPRGPTKPVVDQKESMLFLDPDLIPEKLFFPDYFLMESFELHQHGCIPGSLWAGGDMKTPLGLNAVFSCFSDVLSARGWKIDKLEQEEQFFRLTASLEVAQVEIRAVQGNGPTHVFLLYWPAVDAD